MYVITFYSYKGGVGRTMALVNVATLLAKQRKRVLVVDFDLEAPSLPSFAPMDCARGLPGVVDYVEEYRRDLVAPEAADFIVKCGDEEDSLWVMPAGNNESADYTDRLNAIDWEELYARESGYLMFEDLRQQWLKHDGIGFDYVLIDSRTGHTDVGGICTRQLPDAVAVFFVPNDQNIDGLAPIVEAIRSGGREQARAIQLQFCASNVPDEYDEHGILERLLASARKKLQYGDESRGGQSEIVIHHYTSLELLEKPLVAALRPNSRLSREYETLKTTLIGRNIADRDGALVALGRLRETYEAGRRAGRGRTLNEVAAEVVEIRRLHPDDGEIAFKAAMIFDLVGNFEQELASLTAAIDANHEVARARLARAISLLNASRRDEAIEDLVAVIGSPTSSRFEFAPAIQLLSLATENPTQIALELFTAPTTRFRAKQLLAPMLMQSDEHLDVVADEMLRLASSGRLDEDRHAEALNLAGLALMAAERFEEAVARALPQRTSALENGGVAPIFNLAIAEWALSGEPPRDLFAMVDRGIPGHSESDANAHQCFAVARSVMGKPKDALMEIGRALEKLVPSTTVFNCWTYRYSTTEELERDLREMQETVASGALLVPRVIRQHAS